MKIKEIAKRTGLTEKTIRYYEEKELIKPDIRMVGQRRFREYTDENRKELERIARLRMMCFTIEEIKVMKDNPTEIAHILPEYQERMEKEVELKSRILESLKQQDHSNVDTLEQLIACIVPSENKLTIPLEDLEPDFAKLDRANTVLNLLVDRRIYTKNSLFPKKISDVDVLILTFVWNKRNMSYSEILHACGERGIKNQKYLSKRIKNLCRKRLLRLEGGVYHVEANMPTFSKSEMEHLVQGVATGSPDIFVYTPQAPMSVSSKGYGAF